MARTRLAALDGLRALAALVVVSTHATGAIAKTPWQSLALYHSPLALVLNATGAVHVFFVLSGYCLSASAQRSLQPLALVQFYIRRVFRIHGPFVTVAVVAWAASIWIYANPAAGVSDWMSGYLGVRLSWTQLLGELRFPGEAGGLLPQGWTLEVEMICSFLIPLGVWIATRAHWSVLAAVCLVLFAISQDPLGTPRHVIDFATGIALYFERDRIAAVLARSRALLPAIALAGVLIVTLPAYLLLEPRDPKLSSLIFSCGATLLVLAASQASQQRLLSARPLAYLGRVSYSIYLLHFTVVAVAARLLVEPVGPLGGVAFVLLVAAVTCALSALSYRFVELPCIRAGAALCGMLATSRSSDRSPA